MKLHGESVTVVSPNLFVDGAACGTWWELSCWDPDQYASCYPASQTIRVAEAPIGKAAHSSSSTELHLAPWRRCATLPTDNMC